MRFNLVRFRCFVQPVFLPFRVRVRVRVRVIAVVVFFNPAIKTDPSHGFVLFVFAFVFF